MGQSGPCWVHESIFETCLPGSELVRVMVVVLNEADTGKARRVLDWEPRVFFKDLVRIMVDADLELIGLKSPGDGVKIIEKHHGNWHRWDSQGVRLD